MKKVESIQELNEKAWYRLLKVVYMGFFILLFIFIITSLKNTYLYLGDYNYDNCVKEESNIRINRIMNGDYSFNNSKQAAIDVCNTNRTNHNDEYSRNITSFVLNSLFSFIIIALAFELLRRAFYYVFFGSFILKKTS